jgi:PAS domain S-box-containing protein
LLSRLTLSQKGLLLLSAFLVIQLSFVTSLAAMLKAADTETREGLKSQAIVVHMTKVSNLWAKLAVEFVRVLTHPDLEDSPAHLYVTEIHDEFGTLIELLEQSPTEKQSVEVLQKNTDIGLTLLGKARDAWLDQKKRLYLLYLKEVGGTLDLCTLQSNKLLDQFMENQVRNHLSQTQSRNHLNMLLLVGLLLNIVMVLVLAYVFHLRIGRKIEQIGNNSMRLASGVALLPSLPGSDEISRLDQDFHSMADALTEAARKERALVDNAMDLICSIDADGVFLSVNPASKAILGYSPEDLVEKCYINFVIETDRQRTIAKFQDLREGVAVGPFENGMIHRDDGIVDISVSAHWSETDKSLFCVLHDITQKREMARMKQQFVAMITHDLRSPLTAIGGTLHMLSVGAYSSETDDGKLRIDEATKNTERMLKLISDLLEMEKFDAAMLTLELDTISLSSVVDDSIGSVRSHAEQQKITLSKNTEASIIVEADKLRMVQVLVNLLANAIKFSPPGGSVNVSCYENSNFGRIEVKDSGPGISVEEQQLIFEPFKQAKRKKGAERLEGTGLGLAICKSIIEAHHGTIGVISSKAGSIFWVEIPISNPEQEAKVLAET